MIVFLNLVFCCSLLLHSPASPQFLWSCFYHHAPCSSCVGHISLFKHATLTPMCGLDSSSFFTWNAPFLIHMWPFPLRLKCYRHRGVLSLTTQQSKVATHLWGLYPSIKLSLQSNKLYLTLPSLLIYLCLVFLWKVIRVRMHSVS